jgi:hypothetical protein
VVYSQPSVTHATYEFRRCGRKRMAKPLEAVCNNTNDLFPWKSLPSDDLFPIVRKASLVVGSAGRISWFSPKLLVLCDVFLYLPGARRLVACSGVLRSRSCITAAIYVRLLMSSSPRKHPPFLASGRPFSQTKLPDEYFSALWFRDYQEIVGPKILSLYTSSASSSKFCFQEMDLRLGWFFA